MSPQLVTCLIAVGVNLAGILVIFLFLSHALARTAWTGRGALAVIAAVVVSQLFWSAPAWLIVIPRDLDGALPYALWFGNWLAAGFSIVLLSATTKSISRTLEDSARIDGLGAFATWRHIVFPFVGRDLVLIALFTLMATLPPCWGLFTLPRAGETIVVFQRDLSPQGRVALMFATSLLGVLPLIALFFLAKGRSPALPPQDTPSPPPPLVRG